MRRRLAALTGVAMLAAGLALLLGVGLTTPALANGGIVRISEAPVGPWLVTVYSSPTPLRTGEVDISTLVQDSADAIIDVPITVDATPVGFVAEPVQAAATRRQATNKLFKAAKFDIGMPGDWQFRVRVGSAAVPDRGGPGGVVSFKALVTKSTILDRPFLLTALIALPLLVLAWLLLIREPEEVREPGGDGKPDR
ncbi:MAG: hypothetical protein ACN0LA_04630 [Candidatus Longimicrobiales bacterium M2_2A_002]